MQRKGSLFVVSAPSGTGKTTLVETLIPRVPGLEMSRSYTSRPPRPGEQDGVEYYFISRERFESMRDAGEFLEWADVFGRLYETHPVASTATDEVDGQFPFTLHLEDGWGRDRSRAGARGRCQLLA